MDKKSKALKTCKIPLMVRSQEQKTVQMEKAQARTPPRNNRRELYAEIRIKDDEENSRKFILSFSSEEPYERCWGSEILDHSDGAVDLNRLNSIGVVLFNHKRDYVIGKVNKAWIENNRGYAEIEFDNDDASELIYQKVKSGTLKGVSVGYCIDSIEEVGANKTSADGRFTGPCYIARKWQPYEISIVSVPADETVGVGRDAEFINLQSPAKSKGDTLSVVDATLQINKNLNLI